MKVLEGFNTQKDHNIHLEQKQGDKKRKKKKERLCLPFHAGIIFHFNKNTPVDNVSI